MKLLPDLRAFIPTKFRYNGIKGIEGPDLGTTLLDILDNIESRAAWSPVYALVTDGERRVLQVADWTGSNVSLIPKPATGGYVSATGLTPTLASAIDIRGAQGNPGSLGTVGNSLLPTTTDSTGKYVVLQNNTVLERIAAGFVVWMNAAGRALIGAASQDPDGSAALEVRSTTGGILPPRMTTAQRDAIPSPTNGLITYVTDNTIGFWTRVGSAWRRLLLSASGYTTSVDGGLSVNGGWGMFTANVGNTMPPSANGVALGWNQSDGNTESNIVHVSTGFANAPFVFQRYNGTVLTEYARFSSASNFGVGSNNPTARTHIKAATGYNQLRLETSYTPTSSSDPNGNVGDVCWDANYFYTKTGGGWKRTALSTW